VSPARRVSVVVNTYNRADSLRRTLESLTQLDYPDFEVVVVDGPSTDHTAFVLADFDGMIKTAVCPERNLSMSRNIAVALAAGEIVAFLDDDAYPDPAWLDRIVEGYHTDEVAAVGGPVYDHTGARFQARYSLANRFGIARVDNDGPNPTWVHSSPGSREFPYTIGTNSSFLRARLAEIGGFDEEFEYYLEETDACLRLIDMGFVVRALDEGYVYHKFLSSDIRASNRAIKDRYLVFKNTCYFALKHGLPYASFADVCRRLTDFVDAQRVDLLWNVRNGQLTEADAERFEADVPRAFDAGLDAHLSRRARTRSPEFFAAPQPFLRFTTVRAATRRLTVCLFCQEWPPMQLNGIARIVHTIATGLASAGHVVHVLTRGSEYDRVDLEEGVWVHRLVVRPHAPPADITVPQSIWDYSATLLDELRAIDAHRPVDVVQVPNWDSEGIAVLLAGGFRTVLGLYTPLKSTRAADPVLGAPSVVLDQQEEVERFCYSRADRLLASSPAIVAEIEQRYGLPLDPERIGFVGYALPDVAVPAVTAKEANQLRVLFVGRLEPRKGIDTLLAVIPALAASFPDARFVIVGKDSHPGPDGRTPREAFEQSAPGGSLATKVRFTGVLDDDQLLAEYAACDVFVAPSRFESFGLILLEAMRFAKPVIACRVGGMTDIVEDEGNGFLVAPGDPDALQAALARLLASPELRMQFGSRSRQLFEQRYSVERMIQGINREYDRLAGRTTDDTSTPATLARRRALGEPPPMTPAAPPSATPDIGGTAPAPAALGENTRDLLERLACLACRERPEAVASVVTEDGRIKSGQMVCKRCGVVARITNFKFDFRPDDREHIPAGPVRVIPTPGEKRLAATDPSLAATGRWHPHGAGWLYSDGSLADSIRYEGRFTDAVVRVVTHPSSGVLDIFVDEELATTVDLFQAEGSTVIGVVAAEDLPFRTHSLTIRPRGVSSPGSAGAQVFLEEVVLLGPEGTPEGFSEPAAINRGNPYSAVIERHLAELSPTALILEVGGGDRRRPNLRHLNFEYLKFELADAYGDIHRLPFADASFTFVFSQAVFEHIANPFDAARELIRVTEPGGMILTEVAFMQPLHAVPYHFFNMTPWGVEELFKSCEILESDWFGELSFTVDWLLKSVNLPGKVSPQRLTKIVDELKRLDALVSHNDLRPAASGVYIVARTPSPPTHDAEQ
jgi:glycogen synthase